MPRIPSAMHTMDMYMAASHQVCGRAPSTSATMPPAPASTPAAADAMAIAVAIMIRPFR